MAEHHTILADLGTLDDFILQHSPVLTGLERCKVQQLAAPGMREILQFAGCASSGMLELLYIAFILSKKENAKLGKLDKQVAHS